MRDRGAGSAGDERKDGGEERAAGHDRSLARDYNARIVTSLLLALLTLPSAPYRLVFAPPARAADFSFFISAQPIDRLAEFYREQYAARAPDSWRVTRASASEIFDGAALYDRPRLARLYGGLSPRVARGPVFRDGRLTHVVLLVSPYPTADLSRLNPGTLVMVVRVGS